MIKDNVNEHSVKTDLNLRLINKRYMDYFDDNILDDKDQNTISIYWQGQNLTKFEYLSDKWVTAYINTLNHVYNYIKNSPKTERYGKLSNYQDLPANKLIISPFEEGQLFLLNNSNSEKIINFYKRLYEETDYTIAGVFSTDSLEEAKYSIGKLIDYLDVAIMSYKIISLRNSSSSLEEIFTNRKAMPNRFEEWLYGNDAGRNQSLGMRFLGQRAVLNDYESYNNYAFEYIKSEGDWIGDGGVDYGMLYGGNSKNLGDNLNVVKHWNPRLEDFNFNYVEGSTVDLQYVHSARLYHFAESNLDAKIIKYLKSLNKASINTKLNEYKTFFDIVVTQNLNGDPYTNSSIEVVNGNLVEAQEKVKQISNELKLLYNEEYISTQSSSRKVVEEKEIPTFEEPASFTVVYPNPTEGIVNVKAEKDVKGWKIVSLSGKIIGHNQFNTPKRQFSTNIGNQSGGLYVIQIVYTDGTTESKKIMKK